MNQSTISFKQLAYIGLLGAVIALLISIIFVGNGWGYLDSLYALPVYEDYIKGNAFTAYFAFPTIDRVVPLTIVLLVLILLVCWYVFVPKLNAAFTKLPLPRNKRTIWLWVAWVSGFIIFVFAANTFPNFQYATYWMDWSSSEEVFKFFSNFILFMLSGGLIWCLVSPYAFGRFGNNLPAPFSKKAVFNTFLLGVTYFLILMIVMTVVITSLTGVIQPLVSEVWDKSGEFTSFFGWKLVTFAGMIHGAVSLMLLYGLLPLCLPGTGNISSRIQAARSGLYVAGITLLLSFAAVPYLYYTNILGKNTLVEAAGLQAVQPIAFRSYKFCNDPVCNKRDKPTTGVIQGETITHYSKFADKKGQLPHSPEIISLLEQFVAGQGQHSVFRSHAITSVIDYYRLSDQPRNQIKQENKLLQNGLLKHASHMHSMWLLSLFSGSLPVDNDMRAQLSHMSDEKVFYVGAKAAALLSTAWARFGDMERANFFLKRARKLNPEKYDKLALQPSTLLNGNVTGKVELKGHDVKGLRVTLWRKSKDIDRDYSSLRISDSIELEADGSFKFNQLTDGEYFVGIQLPLSVVGEKDTLTGKNIPNKIVLDKAHTRQDVGVIQLVASK